MDTIESCDVTSRAVAGGWKLPEGWTVCADISRDDDIHPAQQGEAYEGEMLAWWKRDEWQFVNVSVWVQDRHGREWGRDVRGGCEYGYLPVTEPGIAHGSVFVNPLTDAPGEYSPIREYDMIGNALRDAVEQLATFGTPIITEPAGTTVTGL
jgi:hypothetical protein